MKKNYRGIVLRNVEDNFAAFKDAELTKPKIEIFDNAYKINFMENVMDFFEYDDSFDNDVYAFLAKDKDRILDNLYKHYMKHWDNTVSSVDEITDFVRDYYDTYSERGSVADTSVM